MGSKLLFAIIGFGVILSSGCATNHNMALSTVGTSTANNPLPVINNGASADSADNDFRAHQWDAAISQYGLDFKAGLPHGPATTQGTDKFVRHRISLCEEYEGVQAKWNGDFDGCIGDLRMALKVDPSNTDARRLLATVLHQKHVQLSTTNMAATYSQEPQQQMASSGNAQYPQRPQPAQDASSQNYFGAPDNMSGQTPSASPDNRSEQTPIISPDQVNGMVPVHNVSDGSVTWEKAADVQQQMDNADAAQTQHQVHQDELAQQMGYNSASDIPGGIPDH